MKTKTRAGETDALLGQKLKSMRCIVGLSQAELATSIGVTFQQLQKYERGKNRVSVSTLLKIADTLDQPVESILNDLIQMEKKPKNNVAMLHDKETKRLLHYWHKIEKPEVRKSLLKYIKSLGDF